MLISNMGIQIKKGDIVIIVLVLLFAGVVCLFIQGKEDGEYIRITAHGETDIFSISEDRTIEQKTGKGGYNTIVIKDNEVYMENASCPDQICVHHKAVSKNGESIICLPNEVYIEIEGSTGREIDN